MKTKSLYISVFLIIVIVFISGCTKQSGQNLPKEKIVPHEERWGIYSLYLETEEIELIYHSSQKISTLNLDKSGNKLAFSQRIGGNDNSSDEISLFEEILTINVDGSDLKRLTDNNYMDIRPVWSPDSSKIIFLRFGNSSLDIYIMDVNDSHTNLLYDSGYHDADIDWQGNKIAFTRNSQIWIMDDDGTNAMPLTNPPNAGEQGNANLPFGDYDPRIKPDGTKIVFERLLDDSSSNGNYDIFRINSNGSGETRLTDTGYSQGLASWSHTDDRLVYIVAANGTEGKFDIYMMNSDGANNQNIMPEYTPSNFLAHAAIFSQDDLKIYFIGEWWE